ESFRWLLGLYRTWSFLLFTQSDARCVDKAMVALLLAESLGDRTYAARTAIEIHFMAGALAIGSKAELRSLADRISAIPGSDGDLPAWRLALHEVSPRSEWPLSLKYLFGRSRQGRLAEQGVPASAPWGAWASGEPRAAWVLDRSLAALFDLDQQLHHSFKDDSPILKMVELLARAGRPIEIPDAFEQAWGIRWSGVVHPNTLSVALCRLNARSASYSIRRKNGLLALGRPGYISD
ncbi:MAG TPA: hypothetical protein VM598_01905, partial [Bdellovibrionota bacterium]|nr:hypothetical protein [Bdellovibrionota bacterium]